MRARNLKPGFFSSEDVGILPPTTRLLFIGLWCLADREGRLEDRPKQIRGQIFPYEMSMDVDVMLNQLSAKLIERYEVKGIRYIQILKFAKHQSPHYKEPPSEIPHPKGHKDSKYLGGGVPEVVRKEVFAHDNFKCKNCGATNNLTIDHIKPRVFGGSNNIENLQCLCKTCNASKNNRMASQSRVNVESTLTQHRPSDSPSLTSDSPSLTSDSITSKPPAAPDFEKVWGLYPRRKGRKAAERHFKSTVKTAVDFQNVCRALENYKRSKEVREGFIQNGSTWFNNWTDWLEGDSHGTDERKSIFGLPDQKGGTGGYSRVHSGLRKIVSAGEVFAGVRNLPVPDKTREERRPEPDRDRKPNGTG